MTLQRELAGRLCVIDADLAGGDLADHLGLALHQGDAGLAALEAAADVLASLAHPIDDGLFVAACPRPELAWLVRDGLMRDLCRSARRHATLVLVDAGRVIGPAHEIVAEADLVILVGDPLRADTTARLRRRLSRLGVGPDRTLEHRVKADTFGRLVNRYLRGDDDADGEFALLVEGRLAQLPLEARG
jgi:hypothetical protein